MAQFTSFNLPFGQIDIVIYTWAKQSVQVATAAMKIGAKAADEAAVHATPVDTGKARSNWVASIDAPLEVQLPPYVPYPKGSQGAGLAIAEQANAAAAIAHGDGVIATFDAQLHKTIYVQNSADHIERLENGYSLQQPGSMLEIATLEAQQAVESYLATV